MWYQFFFFFFFFFLLTLCIPVRETNPLSYATCEEPDHTPWFGASALSLHCLPISNLYDARINFTALSLSLHTDKFCKMPVHDGVHKLSDPYAIFFLLFMRIRGPIVRFHHQKEQQECLRKGYCIISMVM